VLSGAVLKAPTLTGLNTVLLTEHTMTTLRERVRSGGRNADYTLLGVIFIYIFGCTNGRKSRKSWLGDKKDLLETNAM